MHAWCGVWNEHLKFFSGSLESWKVTETSCIFDSGIIGYRRARLSEKISENGGNRDFEVTMDTCNQTLFFMQCNVLTCACSNISKMWWQDIEVIKAIPVERDRWVEQNALFRIPIACAYQPIKWNVYEKRYCLDSRQGWPFWAKYGVQSDFWKWVSG